MFKRNCVCIVEFMPGSLRTTCVFANAVSHRVIPCAPGEELGAAKELHSFVGAASRRSRVIVLIPTETSIMSVFRFPSSDLREVHHMAALQFVRSTPHKLEDIAVAAKILKKVSPHHSLVAAVMTTKDKLTPYLVILEQARLKPDVLTVSTARLAALSHAVWGDAVPGEGRIIGLCLDGALSWGLVARGQLLYSRVDEDGDAVESACGSFADQCRKEFPDLRIPEGILLCSPDRSGVSRRISGVALEIRELASLVRTTSDRSAFGLAPVAFLDHIMARDDMPTVFDLSPDQLKIARDRSKVRSLIAHFAIIAGIFLAGIFVGTGGEWHRRIAAVDSLHAALKRTSTRVKALEDQARRVATVERHISERIRVSAVLQDLSQNIPPGVRLNEADLEEGNLDLQGEADSLDAVQVFLTALASAERITDVRLEGIDKRPTATAQIVSFRMKMRVRT